MNKIERMLQELCPNGVEYEKLEYIGCLFSGLTGKSKEDFKDGNAKFVSYMNVYSNPALNLNIEDKVRISDGEEQNTIQYGDILFTGSSETPEECGMTSIVTQKVEEAIYLNSFCFGLRLNNLERFDVNFLKHLFRCDSIRKLLQKTANGVTRFNVSKKRLLKIEIPVPPLEVQTQIAYILDHFTELAASLQAELQARKEQYEYYRNKLLTFDNIGGGSTQSVTWMKMSEICANITSGGTPNVSKKEYYNGNIPWLRTQEIDWRDIYNTNIKITTEGLANSSAKMIPTNCVIVAMYGATAAKVAVNKIPLCTNQACCNLEINSQKAHYRFVYQWLCKEYENLKAKGEGSQHNINSKKIKDYLIPIPPISEQQRIVSILDKFEALVGDLSQGLPAEIAAVQEQYEYYRDKLLTFKRIA